MPLSRRTDVVTPVLLEYCKRAYVRACPDCSCQVSTPGPPLPWADPERTIDPSDDLSPQLRATLDRLDAYYADHRAVAHAPEPVALVS